MTAAPDLQPQLPRARLRVIHSREPARPAPAPEPASVVQQELPLRWPADRHGESAARRLARYPALDLDPGVPRPEPYIAQVATLVADVLAGARPASQLHRWASLEVQQRLARRGAVRKQRWGGPAAVSTTNSMIVSGTAVLVVVVFLVGPRAQAAGVRMEFRHNRWIVTEVQSPA